MIPLPLQIFASRRLARSHKRNVFEQANLRDFIDLTGAHLSKVLFGALYVFFLLSLVFFFVEEVRN